MGTRGRTSSAALALISEGGEVTSLRRPDPLGDLTDEQAQEWREIVNRLPADWFPRETHGILAQYCRHVVTARRLAELIASLEADEDFSVSDYDKLLKCQARESSAIASLSVKLRISQSATYDKSKKKSDEGPRIWEKGFARSGGNRVD